MDDLAKKLFQQLDDDMPGMRANALEALREHLLKAGRKFRDLMADLENAVPAAKIEELQQKLADYVKANAKAQQNETSLRREVARLKAELKAALWLKANWKIWGSVAAGLLVLVIGYSSSERVWWYLSRPDSVDAGLRAAVASAPWIEGWGEPIAAKVAGQPYWLIYRGDIDASHYSDNHGQPLEMRCLHLYAAPAEPYSRQFMKPSPRNFLGWITWPELAMDCNPSPNQQQADNFK